MKSKIFFKNILLFVLYGLLYVGIELLYRGYSHWSMFLVGGYCALAIGTQNEYIKWDYPLWKQILNGEFIVLTTEFIAGCIVNLHLKWNIWDYSSIPFNLLGQICFPFAILWLPLILSAIILDDYLRYWFFNENKPHYKLF